MTVFSDRAARRLLLLSTTLAATGVALPVFAQDATTPDVSDKAVTTVIVKAEHSRAAANAPAKASVDATQPQSIISRPYIDLVVPETGDFTNVVNIAPSVSGTQGNGAGYGDAKLVLRGFQDGEYNVTYDGIPYGDTNDPTHHSNTFFPASTIGAVIVDRGPGAAGDLGQENYGGAIHMFSNKVQDEAGFTQKLSYGSFNSWQTVSVLQSGRLDGMGGLKVLLNVQERGTDGALSYFSLKSSNQSIKAELPLGDNWTVTALFTHNMNFSHQPDNDGATLAQIAQFGKNFYMNNDPVTPQYYDYNRILKHTDFGYVRVNGDLGHGITLEDTVYTYFYSNHTFSALDVTGATLNGPKSKGGVIVVAGAGLGDVPGYDKLNHYTVNGNILRMNKAWSFGTLKAGGLIETSDTNRHRYDLDMNFQGQTGNMVRDPREKACPTCNPDDKSVQIEENSYWWQYQAFADFAWTPSDSLTVTPGVKYVNFTRAVSGKIKTKPLSFVNGYAKKKYDATLPFLTVNYKLAPNWSLYGQYAQGFQVPALSTLYVNQFAVSNVEPQTTVNYQLGSVYNGGRVSVDGDIYKIDVDNKISCDNDTCVNAGKVAYSGIEGQAAYAFDFGLTAFVNGSLNSAKNNDPTATNYKKTVAKAPRSTFGLGGIYKKGDLKLALTYKVVGEQWADDAESDAYRIKPYDVTDLAMSYDFGRYTAKLGVDNLFDNRATTKVTLNGSVATDQYYFQAPRNVMLTLSGKF